MVAVVRICTSEIVGFLVTHYGIFIFDVLYNSLLEPFLLDFRFHFKWPLFPQLRQVTFDLVDDPTPDLLSFPLWRILQ